MATDSTARHPGPTDRRQGIRPAVRGAVAGLLLLLTLASVATAARAERPHVYAVTGVTVIVTPGEAIDGATVVVRDGLIEAVGTDITPPPDATIIDSAGQTLWAGWIDPHSHVGMKQERQGGGPGGFDLSALLQRGPPEPGTGHPLELVHPQYRVTSELVPGESGVERRRELGFTTALAVPRDGIYRGWSALIALGDGHPRDLVVRPAVAQHIGFDSGSFLGDYPSDLLGAVATIRQVAYDVRRYIQWQDRYRAHPRGMRRPQYNDAFEALARIQREGLPVMIHAGSNRMIERALRIAEEFDADPIVFGSGFEYEILGILEDARPSLVVPVDFPDEPDVSVPQRLPGVSLESLRRWERAPENPAILEAAGIDFALTAADMSNPSKFIENVRRAIEAGLSPDAALEAVTTTPARMLGVEETLGSVEAGKIANLVVGTGAPFAEETEIRHVFVDGVHFEMEVEETVGDPDAVVDPRGEWAVVGTVMGQSQPATWFIEGSEGDYSGHSEGERGTVEFESVTLEGNAMTVVIPQPGGMGTLEATVVIEGDEFTGSATVELPDGQNITISFEGERVSGPEGGAR